MLRLKGPHHHGLAARYLFLSSCLIGCLLFKAADAAMTVKADSGLSGDAIPDLYYFADTGSLQLDTDGWDFVLVMVSTPHPLSTRYCVLCDTDLIAGQQYTAGFILESSQWIRVDPLIGSGPAGVFELSTGLAGLSRGDFPRRYDLEDGQVVDDDGDWSVIFMTDAADLFFTNVTIFSDGMREPIITDPGGNLGNSADAPSWTNASNPLDVDNDGFVVAWDVLQIVNQINAIGMRKLTGPVFGGFFDTDADGFIAAKDAMMIINYLNGLDPQAAASASVFVPEPACALPAPLTVTMILARWHGTRAGRSGAC